MTAAAPLSATRGNRFGIGFFRLLLRCGGFRLSLWCSRIVTWFYARFDRRAFAATEGYLKLRFPADAASPRRLRRHFHRLLEELAKMLIVAYRSGIGREFPLVEESPENLPATGGAVVVLSHCDCWQAAMELMNRKTGRPINIMARPDANGNMDKYLALRDKSGFRVISTEGFSGGLVEASAALARGEAVIVMGDRPVPGAASIRLPFFGGEIAVPLSPWMLAARNEVPAVPVFAELLEKPWRIVIRFRPAITFEPAAGRVRAADLLPGAARYVRELEDFARRRPYRVFRFGGEPNPAEHETESEPNLNTGEAT